MTVAELIELLGRHDGDMEVRIMNQPSWPFELSIAGVCSSEWLGDEESGKPYRPGKGDGSFGRVDDLDAHPVLFIVEGRQLAYGSKDAWDALERH